MFLNIGNVGMKIRNFNFGSVQRVIKKVKVTAVSFCLIIANVSVGTAATEELDPQKFQTWLNEFRLDAKKAGISEETLSASLSDVELLPRVIELDRRQPYKTKTFEKYLNLITPQQRMDRAKMMLVEHRDILEKVSKEYGVQPRFIVALWAVESDFGRNTGGFKIIDSLATLSFEGRRAEFFKKELINALKILDEGHISTESMKGSWAGAMGQTQFMPSSFLELAVDYNNDGRRDIWTTQEDVFASIANYLSKRGWNDDLTWGREVTLPKGFDTSLISSKLEKPLSQWQKLGVRRINGTDLPNRPELRASLIRPEDDKSRTYLVYSNYKTLLKWNRSLYFATAVGILSDSML